MSNIKEFVKRNAWLWAVAGFTVGTVFGTGAIWQLAESRVRSQLLAHEQIRIERELYERLQVVQNEALSQLSLYFTQRDGYEGQQQTPEERNQHVIMRRKLVGLIGGYNRIEAKLTKMEKRPPRWFVIPYVPQAPRNIRLTEGVVEPPPPAEGPSKSPEHKIDPLFRDVAEDLKAIQRSEGLTEKQ